MPDMERSPEEDLRRVIMRAKGGDREAFGVLYVRFVTPVYRYVIVRVGLKEEAEDIVQEVFRRAFVAFGRYDDRRQTPLPYLFTIARNEIIDRSKKKREGSTDPTELDHTEGGLGNPSLDAIQAENTALLKKAIETLSPDMNEAVTLRYLAELSYGEIAETMERSEEAVRKLVSRGLQALRERFANSPHYE
jgi:RNA polymerase sigma-70 factor (ECF subfamily)